MLLTFLSLIPAAATDPPRLEPGERITTVQGDTYTLSLEAGQPVIIRTAGAFGDRFVLHTADGTPVAYVSTGSLSFNTRETGDYRLVLESPPGEETSTGSDGSGYLEVQPIPTIEANIGETVTIDAGSPSPTWIELNVEDEQFVNIQTESGRSFRVEAFTTSEYRDSVLFQNGGRIALLMKGYYQIRLSGGGDTFDETQRIHITAPEPVREPIAIGDTVDTETDTLTEYTIDLDKGQAVRLVLETDDNLQVGIIDAADWGGHFSGHVNAGGSGETTFVPVEDGTYTIRVQDPTLGDGAQGQFSLTVEPSEMQLLLPDEEPTAVTLDDEPTRIALINDTDTVYTLILTPQQPLTGTLSGRVRDNALVPNVEAEFTLTEANFTDEAFQTTFAEDNNRDMTMTLSYNGDTPLEVQLSLESVDTNADAETDD
jgi:hypothetical protein